MEPRAVVEGFDLVEGSGGGVAAGGVWSVGAELTAAIEEQIAAHDANPKPFVGTATASDILEKVKRGRKTLHTTRSV